MNALIFDTVELAQARNHAEAVARGCGGNPGDVTTFWWPELQHPTDGRCALLVGDDALLDGEAAVELPGDFSAADAEDAPVQP